MLARVHSTIVEYKIQFTPVEQRLPCRSDPVPNLVVVRILPFARTALSELAVSAVDRLCRLTPFFVV